jgi:DNA-binding XRE family transcriptional regulator
MNKLKGYRVMAMLTQNDMAKLLNIRTATYLAKEKGYRAFSDDEKRKIKTILSKKLNREFTIDELFF